MNFIENATQYKRNSSLGQHHLKKQHQKEFDKNIKYNFDQFVKCTYTYFINVQTYLQSLWGPRKDLETWSLSSQMTGQDWKAV